MVNWGVYWAFFKRERESWPVTSWLVGSGSRLAHIEPGDRLWLVTSGQLATMDQETFGYLVEVFEVDAVEDINDERFKFKIVGKVARCIAIDPPLLVDSVVRPEGADTERSIGTFRQGPWKLSAEATERLVALLQQHHPAGHATLFNSK
jgi:hypothetical protein